VKSEMKAMVPSWRTGFRLQWEPVQNCHVLLYPEGMIQLNDSAAAVLQLVDGKRPVDDIIDTLATRFPNTPGLDEDVLAFIEVAHAQHWIKLN
jgi:pyrroloquinoline quinone biosynthesis protein D